MHQGRSQNRLRVFLKADEIFLALKSKDAATDSDLVGVLAAVFAPTWGLT
jgi:hypothetical protein